MPRKPRLSLAGAPQHIIQRGNNRQATFFVDEDFRFYLLPRGERSEGPEPNEGAVSLIW